MNTLSDIHGFLQKHKSQLQAALPKHITPDRMARVALTEVRKNPRLAEADLVSLLGAIMQASQLGLEPGYRAYLIPFWNGKRERYEVQMLPDYRGLIDLVRRSGEIGRFSAHAVHAHDVFEFELGTKEFLRHVPARSNRGEITYFYAVAASRDNAWCQFEVMTKAEVDAVRARSRAGDDGPWVTDYVSMGQKTVSKRLCKYLPSSIEIAQAIRLDDLAEVGEPQGTASLLEGSLFDEAEEGLIEVGTANLKEKLRKRTEKSKKEDGEKPDERP
jgi:recombination protein RecT